MSDKATALDELEEMHQQVISSSLLALATLLDVLVSVQSERPGFENVATESKHASKARATAISFAEKLFSANKYFLEFLKSQSPAIRSATYSALKSFIKNIPHAFDEGNMKTLGTAILGAFQEKDPTCHLSMWDALLLFSKRFPESWTLLNVQKIVLNRLWHFLKNGCFGSQQVSYPALVLFLGTVPPKSIVGEKFFLDFFHNLWDGRTLSSSTTADNLAFFRAFKECFFWALHNASRYCDSLDSVRHFRVALVDNILVKLLWQEYLFSVCFKNQSSASNGISEDLSEKTCAISNQRTAELLTIKYPMNYLQESGKCIVEILSGIYLIERDLLSTFCVAFQENCLKMFQLKDSTGRNTENVEQVIKFMLLLEEHSVRKDETWPLVYLVGPMLAKCFPSIRSLDSPDGLRLLSVAVSLFGPRKIVKELFFYNEGHCSFPLSDDNEKELEPEYFMQVFKETFVPWCFVGCDSSSNARIDLLLAFLDDEHFSEQWTAILSYAISQAKSITELGSLKSDYLSLLTMFLEKARIEITNSKVGQASKHRQWSNPGDWHHELLESAVVAVASSSVPLRASAAQFVCAVLSGSTKGNEISFVSRNSMILVYKAVSRKLLAFICDSPFSTVRDSGCVLSAGANKFAENNEISTDMIEIAHFALDVLSGSLYCLKTVGEEIGLVSCILAQLFIMDWEHTIQATIDDALDNELKKKIKSRSEFGKSLHDFRSKINDKFWGSLSIDILSRLGSILVQFIKSVVFKEGGVNANRITSLCCEWMLEILACLCHDQCEEQNLLDQLLRKDDIWPSWIIPDLSSPGTTSSNAVDVSIDIDVSGTRKFVSLIDKLVYKLGVDRVVTGYVESTLSSPLNEATGKGLTSRAWLAAEILCTWQWPGGSATESFLPLLSASAKSWNYFFRESLLDSIFNILLDGALVHGESGGHCSFNLTPATGNELDKIEEPFLRALMSLLFTLFKNNIWGGDKARELFELLLNKLYVGEAVNQKCLKILPLIVSVLIQPLCQRSLIPGESTEDIPLQNSGENWMQHTVKDWLERVLLFPPLVVLQAGQDMEDWFKLVIACYPISAIGSTKSLKLERNISAEERRLIHDLFQKQRQSSGVLAVGKQLPMVQMLLSKLMVVSVGYCWKEFTEEDWEFFFSQLRLWIQSAVVIMEEVTENVNDAITNSSTCDYSDVLRKLEHLVSISDLFPINVAINALESFSLFYEAWRLQQPEMNDTYLLRLERWDPARDRILEGILRIFFCTGLTEAIANSYFHEAASIIATSRLENSYFWELVASNVLNSSQHVRDRAVRSIEFWGLSKGPVSSLYAILFSSVPVPLLQFAAYVILSTEPVSQLAFAEGATCTWDGDITDEIDLCQVELTSKREFHLKEELSCMIEKLPYDVLEMDLTAHQRVNVFLAWSLLLSHLWKLPSQSAAREQLVQYVQDSANSGILDCLFQHIPLELCTAHSLKKKDVDLPAGASEAANAATSAITTGSLLFSVESLWPIAPEKMASLAGALFGLMLHVLPAYVRGWFNDLRDRSMSSLIETFTRTWCSPQLIVNELSQIKKANFADENFSVSVSKSANEVVATYTKDDTGMDLVIRLPASYPLRPVDVECMRSLGISEVKQRKWLMSMMLFVRNQNGALAEAIRIWKSNFDKEFEGIEECPICYSVIHTTNHSLPRLACRTCKHKFHAACLYKWFSTSHKSSCPLCQSPF
ncbi:hypothetical protein JCGZ_13148 [Jatropha curcas]|uniref:E3 ubiquitin-protein ligase listerin n=2 Tax=Jatropha curcas TaxID=180498 RepID=A0A067KC49_JATCU|nr:hypothetical protein JCGZ_13148 [Jatropha curcas]